MSNIVKGENPRKPWTVKYRDDQRKQRERSFATKREAEDFKTKVDYDLKAQIFVDPKLGQIRFGAYAARWVESYRARTTPAAA